MSITSNLSSPAASHAEGDVCELCSLPVGRSGVQENLQGQTLRFCCQGCRYVFLILSSQPEGPPANFKETELYRACLASGLIAQPEAEENAPLAPASAALSSAASPSEAIDQALALDFTFRIGGMWCTACSWLIEHVVRSLRGVLDARVFFLSDTARVRYLPHRIRPEEILARLSQLGYPASLLQEDSAGSEEKKDLLLRLGVSSILTFNIMMISFALYFGFFEPLGAEGIRTLSYPLWILATPVLFYTGFPIHQRAATAFRFGAPSMESLISVGSLTAYFYSTFRMWQGSLHVYFDTASMLITLVLLGKFIELQARERVASGITDLYRLTVGKVRLLRDGRERWVSNESIVPGSRFLVLAGERVPLDGRVVSGQGRMDESVLTGESRPVRKTVGDEAMEGTLVLEGDLELEAVRVGRESSLGQVIALMQEALTRKDPVELLADRITRLLVPLILVLAAVAAAFLVLSGSSADEALLRAVTILVITCPCALGIATPLAKVASIGVGRREGLLIRDPAALEKTKRLDVLVFDKTGTLTEGRFSLREFLCPQGTQAEALQRVASVEAHSSHFLAKEVLRKAAQMSLALSTVTRFESFEGMGVQGVVQGRSVAVGNRAFMSDRGLGVPDLLDRRGAQMETEGHTVVFFGGEGAVQGLMAFGDTLKEGAEAVIEAFRARGVTIVIASGDSRETTHAIARALGIDRSVGEALPKDKVALIRSLQEEGRHVGMVGDGINDAAALAQSDVGFALGVSTNVIQEASDIAIVGNDPQKVVRAFELSTLATKIIRQNLIFAFLYNVLGIPLAVLGHLNPLIAVFAMFASSLTVIANTLRITARRDTP